MKPAPPVTKSSWSFWVQNKSRRAATKAVNPAPTGLALETLLTSYGRDASSKIFRI